MPRSNLSRARDIQVQEIVLDTGTDIEMAHLFYSRPVYSRLEFSKTAASFSKLAGESPQGSFGKMSMAETASSAHWNHVPQTGMSGHYPWR